MFADILQGLTNGGLPFLFAWVLPSAIAVGAFVLVIYPSVDHFAIFGEVAEMSGTSQALVVAFAAVSIALVMSAIDTPMYRLLEGYSWPAALQRRGADRQQRQKRELERKRQGMHGWRHDLYSERLERFPTSNADLAPTSLGNALRAFEGYALDRYNLNSQLLWAALYSAVTEDLRSNYERSRAAVDFFVSTFYLAGAFASLAAATAFGRTDYWMLAATAVAIALMPLLYRLAVQSTGYWARTTKAIVDMGRKDLAIRLGLRFPETTEDERRMWGIVNAFVYYPYEEQGGKALDEFRVAAPVNTSSGGDSSNRDDG